MYFSLLVGGHPHNWNAISQECLSLLSDLTQRLVAYQDTVATNGRPKSLSQGSERKTSSDKSSMFLSAHWSNGSVPVGSSPTLLWLCGCLDSFIRAGGFVQSQGSSSSSVSSLSCWDPSDPTDPHGGPLHSGPQQPLCLSRHAAPDHRCGTVLARFQRGAEPSCPEERPQTLVHLHRLVLMGATQCKMETSVKGFLLNAIFHLGLLWFVLHDSPTEQNHESSDMNILFCVEFYIRPDIMVVTSVKQTPISRCRLRGNCSLWQERWIIIIIFVWSELTVYRLVVQVVSWKRLDMLQSMFFQLQSDILVALFPDTFPATRYLE